MDALARHRQLICLEQNRNILSIPKLQTEIRFNSIHLYSAYYNNLCMGESESETQSQNPQASTARENSLLTGRNLEQDLAYKEEPSC